jgi:hypothetical protein
MKIQSHRELLSPCFLLQKNFPSDKNVLMDGPCGVRVASS